MLVEITGYPAWIFYGFTLGGLVLARYSRRTRDFPRKFRVWLICPLSIVITSIFLSIFPFFNGLEKAIPAAVGLGTILLGALLYFFTVYRRK